MIILKIVVLQLFWFLIVLYGKSYNFLWAIFLAVFLCVLDYKFFRPKLSVGKYFFLMTVFTFVGFLYDSSLWYFQIIEQSSYHYGNLALWIVFITYYDQIFKKFINFSWWINSLVGGLGGVLAYWSAVKLGAITLLPFAENKFIGMVFFQWAVFFPLSLKVFSMNNYWNWFLDCFALFSFDRTGFIRHQNLFDEDLRSISLNGASVLVTGATGGIGQSAATFLASQKAVVTITGRNKEKGQDFLTKFSNSDFVSLDMANWQEVYQFAKNAKQFDHLIFNAGSMPEKMAQNSHGVEFQCASQLVGHYLLLSWLHQFGKISAGARVVWVSSGGMYLKKLDLNSLFHQESHSYDKVATYANVKRAQVTLVEDLAKNDQFKKYTIISMHPGWVATQGLEVALPKFYNLMKNRLRDPSEGADTIVWAIGTKKQIESGAFYFDRKKVSPYILSFLPLGFIPSAENRAKLQNQLISYLKKFE